MHQNASQRIFISETSGGACPRPPRKLIAFSHSGLLPQNDKSQIEHWQGTFYGTKMNKQSNSQTLCVITHCIENNRAYLLRTEITKSQLNYHICQYFGMKIIKVTPSFYYLFIISLHCNDSILSFIGNLWRVLLLENHLNRRTKLVLALFTSTYINFSK